MVKVTFPEKISESKNLGATSLKKLFRGYIFFIHLVQGKRKKMRFWEKN
jgi:hypothetical protein